MIHDKVRILKEPKKRYIKRTVGFEKKLAAYTRPLENQNDIKNLGIVDQDPRASSPSYWPTVVPSNQA